MILASTTYSFGNIGKEIAVGKFFGNDAFNLSDISNILINWIYVIAVTLPVIFVIIAGIKYITSTGDPNKAEEARGTLINAIMGLVIAVSFLAIINVFLSLFELPSVDKILNP